MEFSSAAFQSRARDEARNNVTKDFEFRDGGLPAFINALRIVR
jgi:hypothetical protein